MRQKLALLGTATSIALAAAVVTAAPAEARRNVGGFDTEVCVAPGNSQIPRVDKPGLGPTCICVIDAQRVVRLGPNGKCPPGNDPYRPK